MQRNQFKANIFPPAGKQRVRAPKISEGPKVNTFSDCIRDSIYTTSVNHMIRIRSEKVSQMKNLI